MGDEYKIPDVERGSDKIQHDEFMPSPIEKQIVEDEEEVEFSLQSIRIKESLLGVNPSPTAPELYEISDISSPHMDDLEEDIWISVFEEKHSYSLQKFSSDSLNFVHSLPVTVLEKVEEFELSISNNVAGVQIGNTMDIMEIISDYRSDPFTLINLELPVNSYRIACTENQNFEGENCASTV